MLKKTSKDFRVIFLTEFTREILRGTNSYIHLKVKEETKKPQGKKIQIFTSKDQKKQIESIVKSKIQKDKETLNKFKGQTKEDDEKMLRSIMSQPLKSSAKTGSKRLSEKIDEKLELIKPALKVPMLRTIEAPPTPYTIKDIIPVSSQNIIELGKISPLAKDPLVKTIESKGPNQSVEVTGAMGRKNTPIKLNQNEISGIIQRFSQAAKVPFEEGFFKAAYGSLLISAIVSEATGSKFVITKLNK